MTELACHGVPCVSGKNRSVEGVEVGWVVKLGDAFIELERRVVAASLGGIDQSVVGWRQ